MTGNGTDGGLASPGAASTLGLNRRLGAASEDASEVSHANTSESLGAANENVKTVGQLSGTKSHAERKEGRGEMNFHSAKALATLWKLDSAVPMRAKRRLDSDTNIASTVPGAVSEAADSERQPHDGLLSWARMASNLSSGRSSSRATGATSTSSRGAAPPSPFFAFFFFFPLFSLGAVFC
ncbi:Lateral signaling target protein 2 [Frankliniella fusca]|uniref:Lateral signaling target protein 2 n=1 Tax=Frankliniella fusca TaxID=407009 RepID=A0AAE1HN38_9NEOP|nr:Lateral signaling target protein 2 [Frankliniella fusca]